MPEDELVAQTIQLACGDAGLDVRRDEVESRGSEPPGPPHGFEGIGTVDFDAAGVIAPVAGRFRFLHQVFQGLGRSSRQVVSDNLQ